jgi:hypothetical protein
MDRGLPGVLRGVPTCLGTAATGMLLPIVFGEREKKADE